MKYNTALLNQFINEKNAKHHDMSRLESSLHNVSGHWTPVTEKKWHLSITAQCRPVWQQKQSSKWIICIINKTQHHLNQELLFPGPVFMAPSFASLSAASLPSTPRCPYTCFCQKSRKMNYSNMSINTPGK